MDFSAPAFYAVRVRHRAQPRGFLLDQGHQIARLVAYGFIAGFTRCPLYGGHRVLQERQAKFLH